MMEIKIVRDKKKNQSEKKYDILVVLDYFRIISKYKITVCRNIFNPSKCDF